MEARWLIPALAALSLAGSAARAEEPTPAAPPQDAPVAAAVLLPTAGTANPRPPAAETAAELPATPVAAQPTAPLLARPSSPQRGIFGRSGGLFRLAQAQPAPGQPAVPAPVAEEKPKPKAWTFGGSADFYFSTNFNNPFTGLNATAVYDIEDEKGPHLGLAEVWVQKSREPVGFRLDLNWGPTGRLTNFLERTISGDDIWDHVQQAYVSVNLNKKGNTYFDFGRWVTPVGAEVIEPGGNWLYSRPMYFGLGGPYTHLGGRIYHYVNDTDYWMFHINRGWDVVSDPGHGFNYGLSYSKVLSPKWTFTGNYIGGPDFDSNGQRSTRNIIDLVGAYTMNDRWSFLINADFTNQAHDGSWYGLSTQAKYMFHPKQYVAARFEVMKDTDGFRFGAAGPTTAFGLTLGYTYIVSKNLQTRVEFRHDFSDRNLYADERVGQFTGSQSRFIFAGLLSF